MAERLLIYSDPKISVWCDVDRRLIQHKIHSPVLGATFQAALTKGAEAMERYGADKWLSDDRLNGALFPADLEWVEREWFPRVSRAGWKFWALLPPTSVIGQMNIKQHIALHKAKGITVDVFRDELAALAWLDQQR